MNTSHAGIYWILLCFVGLTSATFGGHEHVHFRIHMPYIIRKVHHVKPVFHHIKEYVNKETSTEHHKWHGGSEIRHHMDKPYGHNWDQEEMQEVQGRGAHHNQEHQFFKGQGSSGEAGSFGPENTFSGHPTYDYEQSAHYDYSGDNYEQYGNYNELESDFGRENEGSYDKDYEGGSQNYVYPQHSADTSYPSESQWLPLWAFRY